MISNEQLYIHYSGTKHIFTYYLFDMVDIFTIYLFDMVDIFTIYLFNMVDI
jgi:hypothetical protein